MKVERLQTKIYRLSPGGGCQGLSDAWREIAFASLDVPCSLIPLEILISPAKRRPEKGPFPHQIMSFLVRRVYLDMPR
ncbi:hypothetical protein Y1Q_0002469 [Alligator mississippiensis]|uniref:Uncharacterized protein n=1 Tax=Alligator mississippiensis TaxID=8496 RepID=A0A151NC16_ALLMI|nr:hypothetical protein Y1Q_0002469 [Alligator mississippiensis]